MHGSLLLAIIILTEDFAYSTVSVDGAPFTAVTNTNDGNIVSNQKTCFGGLHGFYRTNHCQRSN